MVWDTPQVNQMPHGEILTTIEDMIEAMTDMKIMITGTEEGRLLLTTVATGHDQDPVPIAQDAIDTGAIVPQDFASSFWFLDFQASNVSF